MGGMIAQELACAAPVRVATLTLVFTSLGQGVGLVPAPMATQLWIQWHNTRCASAITGWSTPSAAARRRACDTIQQGSSVGFQMGSF